ncbi:MAG: metal ABC transporter permease [Candidatus Thermoplasmatota archaeon]|nr:metal ABC transporter permease [Candidatus Thermoplasmatota archaeon]
MSAWAQLDISDIPRLLEYGFFQRALLGGVLAAVVCAVVGLFLILRKEAMMGDGLAHASFGGIALGLYMGVYPLFTALLVSIASVTGISYMKRKGLAQSDAAIAVMLAMGFSAGLILISLSGGFNVDLFSYLFGSILTISSMDLLMVLGLGAFCLCFLGIFYKEMLSMTFDEDASELSGIPVNALSFAFNILVALTIVLSIKIIGVILVTALLVLPGLAALQFHSSFKKTMLLSVAFALVGVVIGLFVSALVNVATSGVIVFVAVTIFVFSAVYKRLG